MKSKRVIIVTILAIISLSIISCHFIATHKTLSNSDIFFYTDGDDIPPVYIPDPIYFLSGGYNV